MSGFDITEIVKHSYKTLKNREDEMKMKVLNPSTVYPKPYSPMFLCPMLSKICTTPILEDKPLAIGVLQRIDVPICYMELDAAHVLEWKKRKLIRRKLITLNRIQEKKKWQSFVNDRNLREKNEENVEPLDEWTITGDDFIMDFD